MNVREYLDSLRLGRIYRTPRMDLATVFSEEKEFPVYFLPEALEKGMIIEDAGPVELATVDNKTEKDTVVLRGECFDGMSQKRMVVSHDYVRSGNKKTLSVRCVERNNPTSTGSRFSYAGLAPPSVRYLTGQYEVWETVKTTLSSTGTLSRTSSLLAAHESESVRKVFEELTKTIEDDGWVGLVAVMGEGNERYAADIFASPVAAKAFRESLLRSLAVESLRFRGSPETTDSCVKGFLYAMETGWRFKEDGKIKTAEIDGSSVKGSALLIDNYPVHLGFINTKKPQQRPPPEIYGTEVGSSKEQKVGAGKKEAALVPV